MVLRESVHRAPSLRISKFYYPDPDLQPLDRLPWDDNKFLRGANVENVMLRSCRLNRRLSVYLSRVLFGWTKSFAITSLCLVSLALLMCPLPAESQPAAGIPVFETVYVPPIPGETGLAGTGRVTSLSYSGVIFVQPANSVELRLRAPWPTTLQVLINGQQLQQVTPNTGPPQPDDPGYYKISAHPLPSGTGAMPLWQFLLVNVTLPKQFRYHDKNTSVPAFTVTLRDISLDQQSRAPDLDISMAAYPRPPFGPDLPRPPSTSFMSGENSKDDTEEPWMPRASLGVVAQDVTLAGWLLVGSQRNTDSKPWLKPGQLEDWHFDILLDPDFVTRNYPLADAAPLSGAIMPGQPEAQACWMVNANYGCPCLLPGCAAKISLTGGQVPDVGMFLLPGYHDDFHVELNAWHTNGPRGNAPSSYIADPEFPNNAWAFNVINGVDLPHGLASSPLAPGDYVIVTGTLWQDIAHLKNDSPDPLNQCLDTAVPAHGGFLELHPVDVVRRAPPPDLRKHVKVVSLCGAPPQNASYYHDQLKPAASSTLPDANSVLRFEEIADPRYVSANTAVSKQIQVDRCDPTKLNVNISVENRNSHEFSYYKTVLLLWWEESNTPRPPTSCLSLIEIVKTANDSGLFNLSIDGKLIASNVGNRGDTGPQILTPGMHRVTVTAGNSTSLQNYKTKFGLSCAPSGIVTLSQGDTKSCQVILENTVGGNNTTCPAKFKCCEPGDKKCERCIPITGSCF